MNPAQLFVVFCFVFLVSSLVAALLTRAAVTLLNRFAWSQAPVREPLFREAFGVAAGTILIGTFACAVVISVLQTDGPPSPENLAPVSYASIPLNVVVLGALVAYRLQLPFRRGLAISALQTGLQFAVVAGGLFVYRLAGGG